MTGPTWELQMPPTLTRGTSVSWWLSIPMMFTERWGEEDKEGINRTSLPAMPPFAPLSTREEVCECWCSETRYVLWVLTLRYVDPLICMSGDDGVGCSLVLAEESTLRISAGDICWLEDAALIKSWSSVESWAVEVSVSGVVSCRFWKKSRADIS